MISKLYYLVTLYSLVSWYFFCFLVIIVLPGSLIGIHYCVVLAARPDSVSFCVPSIFLLFLTIALINCLSICWMVGVFVSFIK